MERTQPSNPIGVLLELGRRVRHAGTLQELEFMVVNDSHQLLPYRQAALWTVRKGVVALSGVLQLEANVPYTLWLNRVCAYLAQTRPAAGTVVSSQLPDELASEWNDWLPAQALWLPLSAPPAGDSEEHSPLDGGLLLVRDQAWIDREVSLLAEWADVWRHAWLARQGQPKLGWLQRKPATGELRWWQRWTVRLVLALLLLSCIPVRLSVLAPGELVPAHPAVIRAPLDGVIDTFYVQPNRVVKAGEPLFGFDELLIRSQLEVARQALLTAETEYRQTMQQALIDPRAKSELAVLTGKIEEKRAEMEYLNDQLQRSRVLAPQEGIALLDDPSEWIGRPVTVGERIMRVAALTDVEVEAWVPVADAIPVQFGDEVSLYLNASPLHPVEARLRYLAHDALERPDGSYAYRLRAILTDPTDHRVGLKGTIRLRGRWVPLAYWVMRRPLASIRTTLGW